MTTKPDLQNCTACMEDRCPTHVPEPIKINERQRIMLAYFDDPSNPERRRAVRALLSSEQYSTGRALREHGLVESCDSWPYTTQLTELGRQALAQAVPADDPRITAVAENLALTFNRFMAVPMSDTWYTAYATSLLKIMEGPK